MIIIVHRSFEFVKDSLKAISAVVSGVEPVATLALASLGVLLAWFAFAHQRQSTTLSGLDFLHVERQEHVTTPAPGSSKDNPVAQVIPKKYYVTSIHSRGTATRYQVQGAVWGQGLLKVLTPQLPVWGPGDSGVEFELKPGSQNEWEDVYCGIVWERPHLLRNRFVTEGYRVKVERPGSESTQVYGERWNEKKSCWVPLKSDPPPHQSDPTSGATDKGASLSQQLADRHPDSTASELFRRIGQAPEIADD